VFGARIQEGTRKHKLPLVDVQQLQLKKKQAENYRLRLDV
jgi:hypothetical protein